MKINKNKKIELFYSMIRMRMIEEKIAERYSEQEMRCPVHLSIGQEAIASGICMNLQKKDQVLSAHRSHFHYLAKGGNLKKMISEIYGKETGCAGGKGGSMHLIDIQAGLIAAVPIVGSTIPIGVGLAWANKLDNLKKVVVIFFGEGSTEEGVFYESISFAALHNLPVLFVCENNFYSVYSSLNKRQPKKRKLFKVAESLGVKGISLDGNNVEEIYLKAKKIIKSVEQTNNPFFIELSTYRFLEHCGPNNDDHLEYRPKSEILFWKKKCPIEKYKKKLLRDKVLSPKKLDKIYNEINLEINKAFKFAQKSEFPKNSNLMKNIYA